MKQVYLLRGLPAAGKSTMAKKLAHPHGLIFEVDSYFLTPEGHYAYDPRLVPTARAWNYRNYLRALEQGHSPLVVDRGANLALESKKYIRAAQLFAYNVDIKEPDSPWWLEIRELLKNKEANKEKLDYWAQFLADKQLGTHRVRYSRIRKSMEEWECVVTVRGILALSPKS